MPHEYAQFLDIHLRSGGQARTHIKWNGWQENVAARLNVKPC
eukprot:SAG11_NODE_35729_length_265_cov_0.626506_1_plen_41_part_01